MDKKLIRETLENTSISEIDSSREKSYEWCENNWGVWPREKQFLHVVEEYWELVDEILENNLEGEIDELGDLYFTYLTFIENENISVTDVEKYSILRYLLKRTKNIDINNRDLLLLLITEVSKENKVQRKLSWRKDNYKYTELDIKKRKVLNLFLLNLVSKSYWLTVSQLVQNSIDKYEWRDIK